MKKRLTLFLFLLGVSSGLAFTVLTAFVFLDGLDSQLKNSIRKQTEILARFYPLIEDKQKMFSVVPNDLRLTLIDSVGNVFFESMTDADNLTNHKDRKEIQEALLNGIGESSRYSNTLQQRLFYCAVQLSDGNILRTAWPLYSFDSFLKPLYPIWICISVVLFLISLRISIWFTRKFLLPIQNLADKLTEDDSLEQEIVYSELEPFVKKIRTQNEYIRKQLLRLERERLRLGAIVSNMAEGLILFGRDSKILLINEAARTFFKSNEESITELNEIPNQTFMDKGIQLAFAGESFTAEYATDGKFFRIILNPVFNETEVIGAVCFLLDVSEKRAAEKMRQDFTANVSHELKTPLTSISGYAEIIEAGFVPQQEIVGVAGKIKKESARLLGLINDIMKLSQVDSLETETEKVPVQLKSLADEVVEALVNSAEKRKITLSVIGESFVVHGNYSMLFELLYNLTDNAIRYNKDGGIVEIKICDKKIAVRDTGIGIPEEHRKRIFERFYRVDKSRSKATGGTGLGLAIVKHIAERHHAEIILKSEVNAGTEIIVSFA